MKPSFRNICLVVALLLGQLLCAQTNPEEEHIAGLLAMLEASNRIVDNQTIDFYDLPIVNNEKNYQYGKEI